jgi:uncharacterized protein (DUF1778 family)
MTTYALDDDGWEQFVAELDRPAEFKPQLAELLSEPDPFTD